MSGPGRLAKLDGLTDEELVELQEHLEAMRLEEGKNLFEPFCSMVEVPGAPMDAPEPDVYYPRFLRPAQHHKLIIDAVQRLADGRDADIDGVISLAPPGSAKSTYASVLAPPWLLGRKPGTNVIAASYGQDLANRFGRRVRHIVRSPEFEKIMGTTITGDNQAVDQWSLANGSDYRGVGIGAAVTGFRADWLFLDDPIKGREEADSEIIRNKAWGAINDELLTRLKPGGKVFVSLTRWHEDDPAGRILGGEWKGQSGLWRGTDGRLWYVINLPMLAEHADDPLGRKPGEMLWPEWFRKNEIERLRIAAQRGGTASRTWSSLYQQRPAPNDGSILLRSYWQKWAKGTPPECTFIILAYDTALEEDESADFSAMTAWGVFPHTSKKSTGEEYHHDHLILLGAWQDRVPAVDLPDIVKDHCRIMSPDIILVEKRASGHTVIQELKRRRFPVKAWLPKGKPGALGKVPRAHGVAMMLEAGSIHYIPGSKTEAVLEQCATFPYGKHDDMVDTVTMALTFFRDRFMFQSADEEMDEDELREHLAKRMDKTRMGAKGYNAGEPKRRAQNDRRLYSTATSQDDDRDDPVFKRMTKDTSRRLYGGMT